MKTKFSTEDLIHSLPDYITNNISDINLKTEIENELENNPDFQREYSELKNTFGFLSLNDFQSPSEIYFNNLSVKINNKINSPNIFGNFWQRLSLIWKILIPAITVIVIAVVFFSNLQKEKIISHVPENEKNKTGVTEEKISNENKKEVANEKTELKTDESKPSTNENSDVMLKRIGKKKRTIQSSEKNFVKNSDKIVSEEKINSTVEEDIISNALLSDNIEILEEEVTENDEDILYSGDNVEEESLEEEFINLPPDQQQEIIDNLNNTQI
ncbi:MAG: hypothetical protein M3R36_17580 [Bacteroidota bacterium]|nr:hypothetical protein [Bacteroidota bacterium]